MNLKNKIILSIFVFSLLAIGNISFASSSNISTTYHYAYGENVGFIDFAQANVTNTALEGYAYGENIGWINLSGVTNNKGTLGGYAYGENVGFIDFSNVTIVKGVFTGSAYGENIGWITFSPSDPNSKVVTDWRIPTTSSGSSASTRYTNLLAMGNTQEANKLQQQFPNQINPTTVNKITKTLKQGLKNDSDVKTLQTYLNQKLKLNLILDGSFGPKTKQAVISFQKLNKLTPDGIVGPITRALLVP